MGKTDTADEIGSRGRIADRAAAGPPRELTRLRPVGQGRRSWWSDADAHNPL